MMKNYLLSFFVFLFGMLLLPRVPEFFFTPKDDPPLREISLLSSESGTVGSLSVEDYVIGVLSALENDYDPEALCAMAICVRSSALYCESVRPTHENAAVCDDPNCCTPFCKENFTEKAVRAASETLGQILTYEGAPVAAFTHESSGAYTQSGEFFGLDGHCPKSIRNIDEGVCTECTWHKEAFYALLGASEEPVLGYDPSGRVREVLLGEERISGTEFASLLSLPSTEIRLQQTETEVQAVCYGIGHGVGLSRNGAHLLALQGKTAKEILAFYFPNASFNGG